MKIIDELSDLNRFVLAQNRVYDTVVQELQAGHKQSHWIWFIFPQVEGLGLSLMARKYAIRSSMEAQKYWEHPLLKSRLIECTQLVLKINGKSIDQILNYPDDLKFRSSMTLFWTVIGESVFQQALLQYFDGNPDPLTLDILNKRSQCC